jgi:DNA-binding MarR family transcriptional regulator
MTLESKTREVSDCIHVIMTETHRNDKKLMSICEAFSAQEFHVLMHVGQLGNCIMSELADKMQLSLSSITGIVDKLEAKKIVRRDRSAQDRRIVQVVLTDEGLKIHKTAMDGHLEFVRTLLKALDPREQDVFLGLFRKIAAAFKANKEKI